MARVPLLATSDDAETQALIDRLRKGRRGNLLGIYKALLHNAKLAGTWFQHLNAVRWETTLSGRLREILIIRIGWRLDSAYIIKQHIPKLAEPEGLSASECQSLLSEKLSDTFSEPERAAIAAADELTVRAKLSEGAATVLKVFYDDRAIVEIMVLIGTYNMHARFVAGLDIELEKD
ncbi:MAG: alkylhydroperoxidase AhpD family core protein 7 [Hyphomicrobiales bacterium]|nr:alkylhydroperoxidase AhpD family core protein 7 [Hyphomicrobiales bacterium]